MKFIFNLNLNLSFLLGIVILACLFWKSKKNIKEGYYDKYYDASPDETTEAVVNARREADKIGNELSKDMDIVDSEVSSKLDAVSNFFDTSETVVEPQWRSVYSNGITVPETVTTGKKPDTSLILTDGCSVRSFVRSEYEDEMCAANAGDYETIDKMCKQLSNDNCTLPSCCILLNGTKCVAGNINGPTYLTDQGHTIDYFYYYYKNKCYGAECNRMNNKYQKVCGIYADNATSISKDCMVEMFHKAGCKNPDPSAIINDDYVYNNSKSSKKYIEIDLTKIAKGLLKDITLGKVDSRIKCQGGE